MNERVLVCAGTVGAVVAAVCCATPMLAVPLPLVGLGAWLGKADYLVFPVLIVSLGFVALGLLRRRTMAASRCRTETAEKDLTS